MIANVALMKPTASIVIPAYNEANVIGRCLRAILDGARPGEFEIIVVCNGCSDRTAETARAVYAAATVVEIGQASKTEAINAGCRIATAAALILLDADLVLAAADIRKLVAGLGKPGKMAAVGRMEIDTAKSSPAVRLFLAIWQLNPYFSRGKFGGAFALSTAGAARVLPLPAVTADDEYVRRHFAECEAEFVADCKFTAVAPRRLGDLVRIRSRSIRGRIELGRQFPALQRRTELARFSFAAGLLARPDLWAGIPVYLAVSLVSKRRARAAIASKQAAWERDDSSRRIAPLDIQGEIR